MNAQALAAAALVGVGLAAAAPGAAPARAAEPAAPDYALLDAMAEQASTCEQASEKEYWTGVPHRMKAALAIQASCLEEVAATLAREFYAEDAFGPGGIRARIADLRTTYGSLYEAVHTRPLTCRWQRCDEIYEVWAMENTVSAVRALVDAIIDRVKDQSPLHRP